ncbi:cryptochrome/photolyase family protein [Legionella israelensis]|uniref:Deoxyribodipyrimidine photo-lyase n=1 Tax=Legionella israelensis TaxID=454 RepID=A0A0W0WI63_9GAMM|nr:deoxyribodipyrimidine photo-lyase [Legionella israelensis]KTD32027.1 deoxyribodipyrimidine photolyase [Legionella israelensis]QBS09070.1 deoxyribodipyrimidine photo-lyase [Legionella israelensis]SCY08578.1 deoxyribodipyrimidine photo-lyase [Legionella israelensis DSM 19235]STX58789.1 deoxyribodipyrimidine photolyase [Legionella israelensis]
MNITLIWFRKDLRLTDNPAFISACNYSEAVIPLYILDKTTNSLGGAQQWWIHYSLQSLADSLQKEGLKLVLRQGNPLDIIVSLTESLPIQTVYWNHCYEPLAIKRDKKIKSVLQQSGIEVKTINGSLLNEPWKIKNQQGDYYKIFTSFWKQCLQVTTVPEKISLTNSPKSYDVLSDRLEEWNLLPGKPNWASAFAKHWQPGEEGAHTKLNEFIEHHLTNYKIARDKPAENATSKLSPHLHFGEISPWDVWRAVESAKLDTSCNLSSAEHFLSEMGWREFSYHLLYHFPALPYENYKTEFDAFPWQKDDAALTCWQNGVTGYPIIDAGMRELWTTGYMHNRVRMIVASFLTKDLLIDWRLGADWFFDTLVDADLASNSANWQWVAGCGVDAAPYFRIFNPVLQSQKFDPDGSYIRRWVPELSQLKNSSIHAPWMGDSASQRFVETKYPKPIIDHQKARDRALDYYKHLKKEVSK